MRILQLTTKDGQGGAALATYRLHCAFRAAGHESSLLVRRRVTADPHIYRVPQRPLYSRLRRLQQNIPLLGPPKSSYDFNPDYDLGIDWRQVANTWRGQTDALFLHWITKLITAEQECQLHASLKIAVLWGMMAQDGQRRASSMAARPAYMGPNRCQVTVGK